MIKKKKARSFIRIGPGLSVCKEEHHLEMEVLAQPLGWKAGG